MPDPQVVKDRLVPKQDQLSRCCYFAYAMWRFMEVLP